jgi:hypothetical protein
VRRPDKTNDPEISMMCLTNGRDYEQDVTSLRQVDFIMKSGKVSKRNRLPLAVSLT